MSQSDFVHRGQALVSAGQYQEAVKVCRLGLLGRPTTVEGRVVLGQALLALKRFDEVLAEMRVALELDHGSVTAQVLKAEALLRKGDAQAAAEALRAARVKTPGDPRIAALLDEAERAIGRPRTSAAHPAVGFVSPAARAPNGDPDTRAYLPHAADEEDTDDNADEDTGGSFTRPALEKPAVPGRPRLPADATPPPAVLAVGDRSGTVEVDPELDAVELGDDDFADLAAPPNVRGAKQPRPHDGARGAVMAGASQPAKKRSVKFDKEVSTVELADDEFVEIDETPRPARRPGPGTAVRNAVKLPSGPLDIRGSDAASRPTQHQPVPVPPPHLAHLIASQPHALQVAPLPPPQPLPPPPNMRGPIAAALPTAAAMVPPGPPAYARHPGAPPAMMPAPNPYAQTMLAPHQVPAHAQPTMAIDPLPPQPPDPRFEPAGAWSPPEASVPTAEPFPAAPPSDSVSQARPLKTGMRRARSRFQIALWVLLGALVIGGGVFAGFQIRAMRLTKQITAAREQAVALAKADTWLGWTGARDRLAGIAQASATTDNRAALARARALVAFEFGDGYPEAQAAVEGLAGAGGLDGTLAQAYLALAASDLRAARMVTEAAAPRDDAAVLYVTGHAQLLAGDLQLAITNLEAAFAKEARPRYALGVARAHAAASRWDAALGAIDRALALTPDHPGALIERARVLAASGRIAPTNTLGAELRAQLEKVVAEGAKPAAEQPRGVSPAEVALANLALARVDFARGDVTAAQTDLRNALAVGLDEQRFAEEVVDTLHATGAAPAARIAADRALAQWPTSRRVRTTLATMLVADGDVPAALDVLSTPSDLAQHPRALVVRAAAMLGAGKPDDARADFDAALAKAPTFEPALIGRAWLELQTGDVAAAQKRIEPVFDAATATPAMAALYGAILRASGEPDARAKARAILEKAVLGPASNDVARASLELARIYRDLGEVRLARKAYDDAARLPEARLENALLMIEDRDPQGGRAMLETLLEDAGPKAAASLLVETARARTLVGDHVGADALIQRAAKAPDVVPWQLERERGRLALRKADYAGAAQALGRALDACGGDPETFMLTADAASDGNQTRLLARLEALAPKRLAGRPELQIINGKLALASGDYDGAGKAYEAAGKAYDAEKATLRRIAQANFGRAVAAYFRKDDPVARNTLDLVIEQDPSIFAAYLYLGDMVREKDPKRALELAQKAVRYNPDLVEGWVMLGSVAARLRNRKLLAEAITRVGELAPSSEALAQLQSL